VNRLVVIACGGMLGSMGRYAVGLAAGGWDGTAWPWATLIVNIVGAFVIGIVAVAPNVTDGPALLRPFLITGVLGGFTTFSAFALETGVLLDAGRITTAALYVAATMVAGLVAVRLGTMTVRGRSL
jgi:CrcB protein